MPAGQNDRPHIELEPQANGLIVRWGPSKGLWGIFKEGVAPVEVEIKDWRLYVGTLVNPQKPEQGSKEIYSENLGTKTEMMIPSNQLPQHKVIEAFVIGYFESKKPNGQQFLEGIYSDPARMEIN